VKFLRKTEQTKTPRSDDKRSYLVTAVSIVVISFSKLNARGTKNKTRFFQRALLLIS